MKYMMTCFAFLLTLCAFSSAQEKKATIIVNVNKVIGEINPWIFGSNAMLAKIIHKASEPRLAEVRSKNVDAWQAERGLSVVGERPRQITRLR